ncbi:VRR-NUC domain-containing protein [Rhizobium phaseoli]|uniref:VRR-NUC domain-containing protein n=1 Tax=Rhizobium phaseoli TaxID=396 RepID=UPI002555CBD8|nr:VRR-NUC domain-containing protein [Rhizobium phaseoli]MDK4727456.1 VRR-NUC domain-containing protein [Rhizobium phaseoli]
MAKTTQTTKIDGKRVRIVTTTGPNGTKVKVEQAPPKEWVLQAAQVRALRTMPEYARNISDVMAGRGKFTIAGDQNSAKRGPKARMEAVAAGMTSGEHDVRIYMAGGVLGLIENKVGKASLEQSQKDRHPLLAALGFSRQAIIRAVTEEDAVKQAVEQVRVWLADVACS